MKKPVRFFRSVAFKLYIAAAVCILSLLGINLFLNTFAFSDYYRDEKALALTEAYNELNSLSDDPAQLMAYLKARPSGQDPALLLWNDYQILFRDPTIPLFNYDNDPFVPLLPLDMDNGTYTVTDRPFRGQSSADVLILYGRTRSGFNLLLQASLADTDQSTSIANRFLFVSSLVTLAFSVVAIWFLSRYFTRPVLRLSAMAQRMAALDFGERYYSHGKDELAELGNSLNTVSETMEATFSELKTANARLLGDMERSHKQTEAHRSFITNVSHELKTPIALIQTYAEGLRENVAEDEEQRAFYCEVITDEAQRLSQIISRMTMLMQLESGKEELQIERFDIRELCQRLFERSVPLFKQRQVLPLPLPSESAFVWGDPLLIENVMTNYLSNALHHVEENGRIRVDWYATENGTLRITVFNSGSPIPSEDLPRIWESFYKVDKARTREYGGTGIGLSVVAAIMRVHRMPYGVINHPDGVEFYIELPIK